MIRIEEEREKIRRAKEIIRTTNVLKTRYAEICS